MDSGGILLTGSSVSASVPACSLLLKEARYCISGSGDGDRGGDRDGRRLELGPLRVTLELWLGAGPALGPFAVGRKRAPWGSMKPEFWAW